MAGRRVAVNTLNNLGELTIRHTLREAGADPDDVTLVEVPFPEMAAALERGDVDVIWAVEPGVTVAKATVGAVVVSDSYVGPMEGFPVAGYQVTREFADRNPNTTAAFARAMAAAARIANDDRAAVGLAPAFGTIAEDLREAIALPMYRDALSVEALRTVYDSMVEFGIADEGLDVASLVVSPR
jgi:NitT/TauT family transport system substrate-binding protein